MLFVIDVGNTNVVMGIYDNELLIKDWRIRTERNITDDELNLIINGLFTSSGIKQEDIEDTIISCVVPPMMFFLDAYCRKYLRQAPIWVDAKTTAQMIPNRYSNPHEVGADRIVNAVAAYERYKQSLIIIDFGTATTFDAVSEKGEYLGGATCPGIMIASEALFQHASKLPRVEIFSPPEFVIGKDTINSIKAGIIFGYAGLTDGIVNRMKEEMEDTPKIVATGGLSPLLAKVSKTIEVVDTSLTLEGLRIIHKKIKK